MPTTTIGGMGRLVTTLLLALVAAFGMAACGDKSIDGGMSDLGVQDTQGPNDTIQTPTEPPQKRDEKPGYVGLYDTQFRRWVNDNEDSTVVVTAKVEKVISDNAFTLAGAGDTEDLLVLGADKFTGLRSGTPVVVTGKVHKAFNLPMVEDDIHVNFENDSVLQAFDRDPYVEATRVDTSARPTQ
jgi:hypothetical protein